MDHVWLSKNTTLSKSYFPRQCELIRFLNRFKPPEGRFWSQIGEWIHWSIIFKYHFVILRILLKIGCISCFIKQTILFYFRHASLAYRWNGMMTGGRWLFVYGIYSQIRRIRSNCGLFGVTPKVFSVLFHHVKCFVLFKKKMHLLEFFKSYILK